MHIDGAGFEGHSVAMRDAFLSPARFSVFAAWLLCASACGGTEPRTADPGHARAVSDSPADESGNVRDIESGSEADDASGNTGAADATADTVTTGAPSQTAEEPLIGLDTHVDTTQRMLDEDADVMTRLEGGHLDAARMREGGLHGAFFSIWVDPRKYQGDAAWARTLALIAVVRGTVAAHPSEAALCTTAEEVRRAVEEDKIAFLMGVEGGHALGTRQPVKAIERLRELHALGVRYMTITWSNDNPLGHSSTGAQPGRGLTALGRRVVREMNALGIIVDVSHVSDRTASDILDVSTKPVFASHSSARALADHPRNMPDALIRRVAEAGGAVCINYYTQFIDDGYRARRKALEEAHAARFAENEENFARWRDRGAADLALAQELDPDVGVPDVRRLGDHFAHVAALAGAEAVCLGSDFDGVPELPLGVEDVAQLPALRAELERRGLPLRPIWGENVLRVLAAQTP